VRKKIKGVANQKNANTVKDPSDPIHRDHSLGLVLVQARAYYNSHNRPDITSAVGRCFARRSSLKPHFSHPRAIFTRELTRPFSSFSLYATDISRFKIYPGPADVSSDYHRLWYAVTGPTTPATRVKTNAPCSTRESSSRTNFVCGAFAVARPNLAFLRRSFRN